MAITELTQKSLGKKKSGWRWDKKRELWVTWILDTTFDGARHVKRGFLTERAADDYLKQLKIQERLKQIGVVSLIKYPTVKKLFDVHCPKIEVSRARVTARRVFDKFLTVIPKNIRLDELRRKHFKDYVDARLASGVTAQTAHREVTEISSALHKAGDYFETLENWNVPEKLIYRPPTGDEGRERVITRDERNSLLKYLLRDKETSESRREFTARRRTGLIFYFGLLTGLRHGEISALSKNNFDGGLRRLRAERFKTKKSGARWTIFEPLTDTQMWILEEAALLYPDGEFFLSDKGKPHNKFYEIIKAACGKLKIDYGKNNPRGFVMHDTRHTFVTILEHGAVDSSTTRSFSGHSKDAMMKRYAHATPDSRSRAMQIIERELGQATGPDNLEEQLKKLFEAVQSRTISFEDFKISVESFDAFLAKKPQNDVADVADVTSLNSDLVQ